MTNKEKAKILRKITRKLSVWKESGPKGPEHSKEARKSAEEAMKLLGANADLLHNCKETYGVKYRQSESSLKSLNGILDGMRINNQPLEFIIERIGYYDYQDFAQDAFIDQLNQWADELEKDKTGLKNNVKVPPPIDTKGLWSCSSLEKLREIDSNVKRNGIPSDKKGLKQLKDYVKRRRKRPDIAKTLYYDYEDGQIKTTMSHRSMFKPK